MARKKIHTATNAVTGHQAKVYRDAEFNEYRVCYWLDGSKVNGADYHTDDKQDAISTANLWTGKQ